MVNSYTNCIFFIIIQPFGTGDFGLVKSNNVIYLIGGELWSTYSTTCDYGSGPVPCKINEIPNNKVLVYDNNYDIWIEISPLRKARFRNACAVYKNMLYTFGGSTENEIETDSVEGYNIVDSNILYYHYKN